jgi:phosphoglycerate dehydrogenase-like enzyme
MTKLLTVMPMPERFRRQFKDEISKTFADLTINVVEPGNTDPFIEDAEILMAHHVPDEVLAKAKRLKWVQTLGTGTDGFLTRPHFRKDTLLTRMHDVQGSPGSEAVLAIMLAFSRQLPRLIRNQMRGLWDRDSAQLLEGKTVGILGVGKIAEGLAPKCRALGMRTVGISSGRTQVEGFDEIRPRSNLIGAVRDLDFLVVLVPLSLDTRNCVNADVFNAMKPSAYLINIARGGIVDEDAALAALKTSKIAGAGLDVFVKEPLPADHPFWSMDNVIITPHAAAMHDGYVDCMLPVLRTNIGCYLRGDRQNMVNVVEH